MSRAACDCCDQPALALVDMDGVDVVEIAATLRPTPEQIRSAPRRRARWCLSCARAHEKWKASVRRRHELRLAAA
jgi:hypothetical protein